MDALLQKNKHLVVVVATRLVDGFAPRYAFEHPSIAARKIGQITLRVFCPNLNGVLHRDFNAET